MKLYWNKYLLFWKQLHKTEITAVWWGQLSSPLAPHAPPCICVGVEGPWASVRQADDSRLQQLCTIRVKVGQHNTSWRSYATHLSVNKSVTKCAERKTFVQLLNTTFSPQKGKTLFCHFYSKFFFLNQTHNCKTWKILTYFKAVLTYRVKRFFCVLLALFECYICWFFFST